VPDTTEICLAGKTVLFSHGLGPGIDADPWRSGLDDGEALATLQPAEPEHSSAVLG
jgi:hypothetical protein